MVITRFTKRDQVRAARRVRAQRRPVHEPSATLAGGEMATTRLPMRHLREILRQKHELKRSHRAVARSLGVSSGAVAAAMSRSRKVGLDWAQIQTLSDEALEEKLYGPRGGKRHGRAPLPDPAHLHVELRRPGVTLQLLHLEYLEQHPERLPLHGLLRALQRVGGQAQPVDAAGAPRRRQALRRLLGQEAAHRRSEDGRGDGGGALRRGAGGVELHVRGGDAARSRCPTGSAATCACSKRSAGYRGRSCPTSSRAE